MRKAAALPLAPIGVGSFKTMDMDKSGAPYALTIDIAFQLDPGPSTKKGTKGTNDPPPRRRTAATVISGVSEVVYDAAFSDQYKPAPPPAPTSRWLLVRIDIPMVVGIMTRYDIPMLTVDCTNAAQVRPLPPHAAHAAGGGAEP